MKSFLDDLIGHMRAVKVAGVNVVHAGGDSRSQNIHRSIQVAWRPPNTGAGQLHGAVAHAVNADRSSGKAELATELYVFTHFVFPSHIHGHLSEMEAFSEYLDYRRLPPVASFFEDAHEAFPICGPKAGSRGTTESRANFTVCPQGRNRSRPKARP